MPFLPIVTRELRVNSRRAKTYWVRTGVAAVMLVVAGWILLVTVREAPAARAVALFVSLTGALVFVGGFSGLGATADALSSEKREGTLGLLFLTPLRGHDVVFGKICAGSLSAFYGLLSVTPLVALPLLMGGVTVGEVGRMTLVLLNTMFLSLAAGICVSAVSRDERLAVAGTLGVLIGLAAGMPLLGLWVNEELRQPGAAEWFVMFSPGYTYAAALDPSRGTGAHRFWASMGCVFGLTLFFLVLACWLTPRMWQDRPGRGRRALLRGLGAADSVGEGGAAAFRSEAISRNAFYWLTTRPRSRPVWIWLVLGAGTMVWLGFGMKYPRDMFNPVMYVVMALAWGGVLKTWVALEATRQIARDRRSGSIELLLSTPLTIPDIRAGLARSLWRQFCGPVAAVLGGECVFLLIAADEMGGRDGRLIWGSLWGCIMVMLLADLAALYAVGLWQSAVARGPVDAAWKTGFRILALPWVLYAVPLCLVVIGGTLGILKRVPEPEWVFWLGSWLGIGLAVDLYFGLRAWRRFHSQFREAAARRGAPPGWWRSLGAGFGRLKASGAQRS